VSNTQETEDNSRGVRGEMGVDKFRLKRFKNRKTREGKEWEKGGKVRGGGVREEMSLKRNIERKEVKNYLL